LDAGLPLEHVGDLLRGLDRHRAIPDDLALTLGRRHVDRLRQGGACRQKQGRTRNEGAAAERSHDRSPFPRNRWILGQSSRPALGAATWHWGTSIPPRFPRPCPCPAAQLVPREATNRVTVNRGISNAVSPVGTRPARIGHRAWLLRHERRLWRP